MNLTTELANIFKLIIVASASSDARSFVRAHSNKPWTMGSGSQAPTNFNVTYTMNAVQYMSPECRYEQGDMQTLQRNRAIVGERPGKKPWGSLEILSHIMQTYKHAWKVQMYVSRPPWFD